MGRSYVNVQLVILVSTSCLGAVLFGYDTGFIGPTTTTEQFKKDFNITSKNKANISSLIVSFLQVGCFVGTIIMGFLGQKIGRRQGIAVWGIVFDIGAILQTVSRKKIGLMYAGRVISGLGIGGCSLLVPAYLNEMSPKIIRGKISMFYGVFLFFSIAISYWVVYACHVTMKGSKEWIVPVSLQLVFGTLLTLGMIPLKESPRWLVTKGREEDALKSLQYIRKGTFTDEEILEEFEEIVAATELELQEFSGRSWKELLSSQNLYRVMVTVSLAFLQQACGTNSFTYFSATFFELVGIKGNSTSLFATGVYGIVKAVTSLIWALFGIERVGRKKSLIMGSIIMGTCMFIIGGIYVGKHVDKQSDTAAIGPANYVMIVFIYIFCVGYASSWGAIPWVLFGEMYSNRVRDYGMCIGAASQWAFNYAFTRMIPYAIQNITWRTFIMFGVFSYFSIWFTYVFIKETAGVQLEDMDKLFADPWNDAKRAMLFKQPRKVDFSQTNVQNDNISFESNEKLEEELIESTK